MLAGAGALAWLLLRRGSSSTQTPAVAPFASGASGASWPSWGTAGRDSEFPANTAAAPKNAVSAIINPDTATTGGNMYKPRVYDFGTWGGGGNAPNVAPVDSDGIRTFADGTSEPIANTAERRQQLLAIWADQAAGKPGTLGGYLFPGQ